MSVPILLRVISSDGWINPSACVMWGFSYFLLVSCKELVLEAVGNSGTVLCWWGWCLKVCFWFKALQTLKNLNSCNCCFHLKRRRLHPSTGSWQLWHGNRAGHGVIPIWESPVGLLGNINRKKVGSRCSKRAQRQKTHTEAHSTWHTPALPGVVAGDYVLSKSWLLKHLICSLLNKKNDILNHLFQRGEFELKIKRMGLFPFLLRDYRDQIYLQTIYRYHPVSVNIKVSVLYKRPFLC